MHSSSDIDDLVKDADIAIENFDQAKFLSLGSACIEASIAPGRLARLAIKARQHGLADCGRQLLEQYAIKAPMPNEAIYAELAFQKRIAGFHHESAELFSVAAAQPNARFSTKISEIHMLFSAGLFEKARAAMAAMTPKTASENQILYSISEFGDYLKQFPKQDAEKKFNSIKSDRHWLDHEGVSHKILTALETGSPFSLIRLGDGEGAFLRLGKDDEIRYSNLYDANRQNRMAMWFGPRFDWRGNGFFEETLSLTGAVQTADIVAIPDVSWLRNSYRISSQSGVPSLVNIMRFFSDFERFPAELNFTMASIAKELQLQGHYEVILRIVKRATVISCLPELPNLLRNYFGIKEVTFIQIPGEQGSRQALGEQVDFGAHYPDFYKKIHSSLRKSWNGELVLIAGGFLGKLYASTVKLHGGVALDIGSLADRWLGKKTRPGDDPRFKLDH